MKKLAVLLLVLFQLCLSYGQNITYSQLKNISRTQTNSYSIIDEEISSYTSSKDIIYKCGNNVRIGKRYQSLVDKGHNYYSIRKYELNFSFYSDGDIELKRAYNNFDYLSGKELKIIQIRIYKKEFTQTAKVYLICEYDSGFYLIDIEWAIELGEVA